MMQKNGEKVFVQKRERECLENVDDSIHPSLG